MLLRLDDEEEAANAGGGVAVAAGVPENGELDTGAAAVGAIATISSTFWMFGTRVSLLDLIASSEGERPSWTCAIRLSRILSSSFVSDPRLSLSASDQTSLSWGMEISALSRTGRRALPEMKPSSSGGAKYKILSTSALNLPDKSVSVNWGWVGGGGGGWRGAVIAWAAYRLPVPDARWIGSRVPQGLQMGLPNSQQVSTN